MLSRDDRFDSKKSGSSIARVVLSIPASDETMESLDSHMCKFIVTCNELCTWPAISYFSRGRKNLSFDNTWEKSANVADNYYRNLALSFVHTWMYCASVFRDHRLFYKRVYVLRSACIALFSERRVYDVTILDRSFHARCKVCYYKVQTQFIFVICIFKFSQRSFSIIPYDLIYTNVLLFTTHF